MKPKIINTIRGQVYQFLKQAICDGEFQPGQWLQENELAQQFAVSRSPIREALRQLVAEGLAIEIPNKGVFVREFTPKDIDEIFDIRIMMENYSIEQICIHPQKASYESLSLCLEQLEKAYEQNNLSLYKEIDTELHDLLIRLSGNSLLSITYEQVHTMIQQFRAYSLFDRQRFEASIIEHRGIVENVLANRPKAAQEINQKHLQLAKEQIISFLSKEQHLTPN